MREDAFEHRGVTCARHLLELVAEIAVVIGDVHRHACGNGGRKFFRRQSPLLRRVAIEDGLVDELGKPAELFALRSAHFQDRNARLHSVGVDEEGGETLCLRRRKEDRERGQVEGDREEPPIDRADDAMLVRSPLGEMREIGDDFLRIGVEDVRAVAVAEHAVVVAGVVGIAGDVVAPIDDEHLCVALAGEALRQDRTGEAGANDEPFLRHPSYHCIKPSVARRTNSSRPRLFKIDGAGCRPRRSRRSPSA